MARITYRDLATLTEGRSGVVRINHEDLDRTCSGHSNSALIEERDDGISFHCFRCGLSTFRPHPGSARSRLGERNRPEVAPDEDAREWKRAWPGGDTDLLAWPQDVLDWATAALDVAMVKDLGMAWDSGQERLWIPVYLDGVPVKWNGRKFRTEGPKYLTGMVPGYKYHDAYGEDRSVILTEDVVGAMRLAHTLETSAYPMLGVAIDHQAVQRLIRATEHVVVWLDNDGAQVLRHRRKLVKLLDSLGASYAVYRGEYDPKREPRLTTAAGRAWLQEELEL